MMRKVITITHIMERRIFPILITIFFLFVQEDIRAQSASKFTVKGVIDTVPHATYFVTYKHKAVWIRDTISLDADRKFKYVGTINEPTIFNMTIKNTINPLLIGNSYVYTFWVEPGKTISFAGKTGWLVKGARGLVTNPNKYHLENSDMEIIKNEFTKNYQETISTWEKKTGQLANDKERGLILDSLKTEFIRRHPDNYYSIYLLNVELKQFNPNYAFVEKMMDKLSDKIKNTYLGKETAQRIIVNKLVGIGRVMPDFEQADTLSRLVKLSSFRGKYVLVDFWASWCGPCRKENPYLVEAHKKFASRGFDILGVSLDRSKVEWMKAIKNDQLFWTHVSDLKEFDNAVAKGFFIHAIPDNFLLDPSGVIIARGLRGKELLQKLKIIYND